eukprot:UN04556
MLDEIPDFQSSEVHQPETLTPEHLIYHGRKKPDDWKSVGDVYRAVYDGQDDTPVSDKLKQIFGWEKSESRFYQVVREAGLRCLVPSVSETYPEDDALRRERLLHAHQFLSAWQEYLAGRLFPILQDETGVWSNRLCSHRHVAPKGKRAVCDCALSKSGTIWKINLSIFITPLGILYIRRRPKNNTSITIIEDTHDVINET